MSDTNNNGKNYTIVDLILICAVIGAIAYAYGYQQGLDLKETISHPLQAITNEAHSLKDGLFSFFDKILKLKL